MKVVVITLILQTYIHQTVSDKIADEAVLGVLGESALLPCGDGKAMPSFTRWMKDGQEIIIRDHFAAAPSLLPRLVVLDNGSLFFQALIVGDEATYDCNSSSKDTATQRSVKLYIVSGPENGTTSISPATALPNGTLFVKRGSSVSFNCSSSSFPSQNMSWSFHGSSFSNDSLVTGTGSWLDLRIDDIQPSSQGEYSCKAQNSVSHKVAIMTTQLLVYYIPEKHPQCSWKTGLDPSQVQFSCSWSGTYPSPSLRWEKSQEPESHLSEVVYGSGEADELVVTLNRSLLSDGLTVQCTAQHPMLTQDMDNSCLFTLKPPFPEGDPLITAVEGTNVTLICTEESSLPPAVTTWRRKADQEAIVPGSKYVVTVDGPTLRLTIVNVSHEDEGLYFCRSENPLTIQELEVYLTVKSSSEYTGAIIGIFLAVLIVGSGFVIAKLVYTSRDRICLGGGFGHTEEERGDVISLVESEEEEIFQSAVPRLPAVTNGNHTTLVQIHRIPSSDHEDMDTTDLCPQLQEDTVEPEEPEDLVTL